MRVAPVIRIAIALAAGSGIGAVSPAVGVPVWPLAILAGGLCLWGRPYAVLTGIVLLGWMSGSRVSNPRCRPAPGRVALIVTVHDSPGPSGRTSGTIEWGGVCRGKVRLDVGEGAVPSGGVAVVVGVARRGGTVRVDHVRALRSARSMRFRLRDAVRRRIDGLYGARSGLVQALVLSRREGLDRDLRDRFAAAGGAHLLAISGLHIGVLAGWLLLLLRRLLGGSRAWAVSAVLVWAYVALLGFPPSAIRAALFLTVASVARLRQRNPSIGVVVALAAIGLLAATPGSIGSVGAWLSVSAVVGTAMGIRVVKTLVGDRTGVGTLVMLSLGSSVGATVMTAPITALVFGQVAPIGVLTNLVAIPLAAVAVPGVFLSLVFGSVFAGGAGLALAALEQLVGLAAAIPLGHSRVTPGLAAGLTWALVAGVLVWTGWRFPVMVEFRRRSAMAGWVALAGWLAFSWLQTPSDRLTVHILSVGQGDAIAVRTPHGRWIVVDGGPAGFGWDAGRRVVGPHLDRLGARGLDLLVVTHADADHLGGAPFIVRKFAPAIVMEPGQPNGSVLYRDFQTAIGEVDARWWPARAGDSIVIDSVRLVVLHPTASWLRERPSVNESSVVLRLTYGAFDMLLTGDVGLPAESLLTRGGLRRFEALKVGHHGSRGSTGQALLDAVRPAVALISVGAGNRYGHPSAEALDRLRRSGVPVWRTDLGGSVTIESDGRYFAVQQGRAPGFLEGMRCAVRTSLRLSSSLSTRNGCARTQRVSLPTFSTISPSPRRLSPGRSGEPG